MMLIKLLVIPKTAKERISPAAAATPAGSYGTLQINNNFYHHCVTENVFCL